MKKYLAYVFENKLLAAKLRRSVISAGVMAAIETESWLLCGWQYRNGEAVCNG
jgi:hypothetical protein